MTAIEQKPAMPGTDTGLRKVWTTPTVILSEVSRITADCSVPDSSEHHANVDVFGS